MDLPCHVAELRARVTYLVGNNLKWPWPIEALSKQFPLMTVEAHRDNCEGNLTLKSFTNS
jgi:hypothetical protein